MTAEQDPTTSGPAEPPTGLDERDEQGFEFIDEPLDWPMHGTPQAERAVRLDDALRQLTHHHLRHCAPYAGIVDAMFPNWHRPDGEGDRADDGESDGDGGDDRLERLPFLPVGIFKQRELASFAPEHHFRTLTSSGTSGAAVSRVPLDRQTARRQTRALSRIMQTVLGPSRRPMLMIDSEAVVKRSTLSARGAGVIGMMSFGRNHTFLLDDDMRPDLDRLREFLDRLDGRRPVLFGFTYLVWLHLHRELAGHGIDLSGATLIHSGGWKKLEEERVDNAEFKRRLADGFGITEVVNFYGMAEQVGSVFVEGDDGLLHPAPFADVIVRDPRTWQALPTGEPGVLQVLSAVPTGYPGHSILTEDLGVVEAIDGPGGPHGGKAFRVLGRVPKTELRGCSDTYAADRAASSDSAASADSTGGAR